MKIRFIIKEMPTPEVRKFRNSGGRYSVKTSKQDDFHKEYEILVNNIDDWKSVFSIYKWDESMKPTKDESKWRKSRSKPDYYNSEIMIPIKVEDENMISWKWELKEGWEWDYNEIEKMGDPSLMYRGMSFEEWEFIQKTGKIQSKGDYNLGPEQEGLTYFGTDLGTATHYANGFAPLQFKAIPGKPAMVIGVQKRNGKFVKGTGDNEIGIPGSLSSEEIKELWEGIPCLARHGKMDTTKNWYNKWEDSSQFGPHVQVAWRRIK